VAVVVVVAATVLDAATHRGRSGHISVQITRDISRCRGRRGGDGDGGCWCSGGRCCGGGAACGGSDTLNHQEDRVTGEWGGRSREQDEDIAGVRSNTEAIVGCVEADRPVIVNGPGRHRRWFSGR